MVQTCIYTFTPGGQDSRCDTKSTFLLCWHQTERRQIPFHSLDIHSDPPWCPGRLLLRLRFIRPLRRWTLNCVEHTTFRFRVPAPMKWWKGDCHRTASMCHSSSRVPARTLEANHSVIGKHIRLSKALLLFVLPSRLWHLSPPEKKI